jgi:hypothetical protein
MAAPPGWSRSFLERRILCYRATSSPSERSPNQSGDLLLVEGSTIAIREAKGRFEITVESEDPKIAQNIVDSVLDSGKLAEVAAR